jgi:cation:H+ antiporter
MIDGLVINLGVLIISLVILGRASHFTITNSIHFSDSVGLSKTTVGFLLIAFATSLPELLVSIFSAIGTGTSGVAIGNVLGSNIVNVCLILGICLLIYSRNNRIEVSFSFGMVQEEVGSLYFGLFAASIIPLFLMYVREGSRIIGVFLMLAFIYNTVRLSREKTSVKEEAGEELSRGKYRYILLTLIGVAGVVICSYFLIDAASFLALSLGVPSVIVGSTIVAFGTSIPELATSLEATRNGHIELAFGNVIGSAFVNLTCILGFTLLTSPFTVDITAFNDLAIFSLIANLMLWYFISSTRLTWREAATLLALYAIFLALTISDVFI